MLRHADRARTFAWIASVAMGIAACGSASPVGPSATVPVSTAPRLSCAEGLTDCSSVMVGDTLTFTADPGTSAARPASLDFGDGTTTELGAFATAARVQHTYATIGTYTARLVLADASGTTPPSLIVRVGSLVTASIGAVDVGGLNVVATADVHGGDVVLYEWTFDPATPSITTRLPEARFTYSVPGYKAVLLRATLADGRVITASSSVVVG